MTSALRPSPLAGLALTLLAVVAAGCAATPAPPATLVPTPTPVPTAVTTASPSPTLAATPTPTAAATARPTPAQVSTPDPSVAPTPSPTPNAPPTPAFTGDPFAGALPLPADLRLGRGDIMVTPSSEPGLATGATMPYDLGHCGLYSPVDLDGSLWEPVGGVDRQGGPIDTDAEIGDLINGTTGEVMLVTAERLDWRATSSGVVVVFRRLPGARDYPICM